MRLVRRTILEPNSHFILLGINGGKETSISGIAEKRWPKFLLKTLLTGRTNWEGLPTPFN